MRLCEDYQSSAVVRKRLLDDDGSPRISLWCDLIIDHESTVLFIMSKPYKWRMPSLFRMPFCARQFTRYLNGSDDVGYFGLVPANLALPCNFTTGWTHTTKSNWFTSRWVKRTDTLRLTLVSGCSAHQKVGKYRWNDMQQNFSWRFKSRYWSTTIAPPALSIGLAGGCW